MQTVNPAAPVPSPRRVRFKYVSIENVGTDSEADHTEYQNLPNNQQILDLSSTASDESAGADKEDERHPDHKAEDPAGGKPETPDQSPLEHSGDQVDKEETTKNASVTGAWTTAISQHEITKQTDIGGAQNPHSQPLLSQTAQDAFAAELEEANRSANNNSGIQNIVDRIVSDYVHRNSAKLAEAINRQEASAGIDFGDYFTKAVAEDDRGEARRNSPRSGTPVSPDSQRWSNQIRKEQGDAKAALLQAVKSKTYTEHQSVGSKALSPVLEQPFSRQATGIDPGPDQVQTRQVTQDREQQRPPQQAEIIDDSVRILSPEPEKHPGGQASDSDSAGEHNKSGSRSPAKVGAPDNQDWTDLYDPFQGRDWLRAHHERQEKEHRDTEHTARLRRRQETRDAVEQQRRQHWEEGRPRREAEQEREEREVARQYEALQERWAEEDYNRREKQKLLDEIRSLRLDQGATSLPEQRNLAASDNHNRQELPPLARTDLQDEDILAADWKEASTSFTTRQRRRRIFLEAEAERKRVIEQACKYGDFEEAERVQAVSDRLAQEEEQRREDEVWLDQQLNREDLQHLDRRDLLRYVRLQVESEASQLPHTDFNKEILQRQKNVLFAAELDTIRQQDLLSSQRACEAAKVQEQALRERIAKDRIKRADHFLSQAPSAPPGPSSPSIPRNIHDELTVSKELSADGLSPNTRQRIAYDQIREANRIRAEREEVRHKYWKEYNDAAIEAGERTKKDEHAFWKSEEGVALAQQLLKEEWEEEPSRKYLPVNPKPGRSRSQSPNWNTSRPYSPVTPEQRTPRDRSPAVPRKDPDRAQRLAGSLSTADYFQPASPEEKDPFNISLSEFPDMDSDEAVQRIKTRLADLQRQMQTMTMFRQQALNIGRTAEDKQKPVYGQQLAYADNEIKALHALIAQATADLDKQEKILTASSDTIPLPDCARKRNENLKKHSPDSKFILPDYTFQKEPNYWQAAKLAKGDPSGPAGRDAPSYRAIFDRLFRYGRTQNYTHEQYREVLPFVLRDEDVLQLPSMEGYTTQELYDHFVKSDKKPQTPHEAQIELMSYQRKPKDSIVKAMRAYELCYARAQQGHGGDRKASPQDLITVLLRLVGPKTRKELQDRCMEEMTLYGRQFTYPQILSLATTKEKANNEFCEYKGVIPHEEQQGTSASAVSQTFKINHIQQPDTDQSVLAQSLEDMRLQLNYINAAVQRPEQPKPPAGRREDRRDDNRRPDSRPQSRQRDNYGRDERRDSPRRDDRRPADRRPDDRRREDRPQTPARNEYRDLLYRPSEPLPAHLDRTPRGPSEFDARRRDSWQRDSYSPQRPRTDQSPQRPRLDQSPQRPQTYDDRRNSPNRFGNRPSSPAGAFRSGGYRANSPSAVNLIPTRELNENPKYKYTTPWADEIEYGGTVSLTYDRKSPRLECKKCGGYEIARGGAVEWAQGHDDRLCRRYRYFNQSRCTLCYKENDKYVAHHFENVCKRTRSNFQ